jgi:sulfite reductase alpha subunit-like flavoprotein
LSQTKDGSAKANASQSKKETGHVLTLVERSNVPSNSASFNKQQSEMESVGIHQGVSNGTEQNKMQSTSNKSVRLQNVAWFQRWQEKAAATGNACAFNLLSREERTAKLEEFVRDVKKKHDAAFKSGCTTNRPFNRKLEETENIKVTQRVPKKKVGKKPLRADLLVDGKPYRPRLKRPKAWATPRLYKLIIKKCEEKYGTLKAHRKAQEFVVHLCEKVCNRA